MIKQEIDFIEYASDGIAQAAYISSSSGEAITQSHTSGGSSQNFRAGVGEEIYAGSFVASANRTVKKLDMFLSKVGTPTGTVWIEIWSDDSGVPGSLISNGTSDNIDVAGLGAGDWATFSFASSPSLLNGLSYWIILQGSWTINGSSYLEVRKDTADSSQKVKRDNDMVAPYQYEAAQTIDYRLYELATYLQCYSESSIKVEGSYSLKAIATQTNSLNQTITKALSPSLNLTDYNIIKIYVRASRTGTNFQFFVTDNSIPVYKDIEILNANVWIQIRFPLQIAAETKDQVTAIGLKITNADAENIIYLDNVYAENKMGLRQIIES